MRVSLSWPSALPDVVSSVTDSSVIVPAALTERQAVSSQIVRTHRGQAGLTLRRLNIFTPTHSLHLCRNLDITLQAGNSLLIVGPSGCGKSSMLRAIAGSACLWARHQTNLILGLLCNISSAWRIYMAITIMCSGLC